MTEKTTIQVTYHVFRRHGKRLCPTGWRRTAPAYRTRYSRLQVVHNARFYELRRLKNGKFYIVVK